MKQNSIFITKKRRSGKFLRNCVKEQIQINGVGDHNVSEAIYSTDPEGNGIEVYADRNYKT